MSCKNSEPFLATSLLTRSTSGIYYAHVTNPKGDSMPDSKPASIVDAKLTVLPDKLRLVWKMVVRDGTFVFPFEVLQVRLYSNPFLDFGEPRLIYPRLTAQYTRHAKERVRFLESEGRRGGKSPRGSSPRLADETPR